LGIIYVRVIDRKPYLEIIMGRRKNEPRRALELVGTGKTLELSRATKIKGPGKEFIHFDKLPDGSWRLTWSEETVGQFSEVEELVMRIIRED
jgi:hypothetical protein